MPKQKIVLPGKITEKSHFYEGNEELLKTHLGKFYISYSTASAWQGYREDMIKQKFAGIELPEGVYAAMGNYLGEAVEKGKFPEENPFAFTGQDNFALIDRPKNGEYERMVIIDMGEYIILGFIDIFWEKPKGTANLKDLKTGGKKKEEDYKKDDYTQVVLYAKALQDEGYKIGHTSVWFVRRTGSHVNPPLHISDEQFEIPLEFNEKRVKFALKKIDDTVKEISDHYRTYLKFFG